MSWKISGEPLCFEFRTVHQDDSGFGVRVGFKFIVWFGIHHIPIHKSFLYRHGFFFKRIKIQHNFLSAEAAVYDFDISYSFHYWMVFVTLDENILFLKYIGFFTQNIFYFIRKNDKIWHIRLLFTHVKMWLWYTL